MGNHHKSRSAARRFRFPLHVHISTLFFLLVLAVGGSIAWVSYSRSAQMLERAAGDLLVRISRQTVVETEILLSPVGTTVRLLALQPVVRATTLAERRQGLVGLREALLASPSVTAFYVGYGDGDFFMLLRLADDGDRQLIGAPTGAAYLIQSIDGEEGRFIYLDADLNVLRDAPRPDYRRSYDPRQRSWYAAALRSDAPVQTAPYLFPSTRRLGVTVASRVAGSAAVVGADIRLSTLDETLRRQRITPGSRLVLFDDEQRVVAYSESGWLPDARPGVEGERPRVSDLGDGQLAALAAAPGGEGELPLTAFSTAGRRWHGAVARVAVQGGRPMHLGVMIPDDELLTDARQVRDRALLATLLVMLVTLPLTYLTARLVSRPIRALADETAAIRRFDFTSDLTTRSVVREVDDLAADLASMKGAVRHFLDISATMAQESDFDRLLPRLVDEMVAVTGARAGVLYLADDDGETLELASLRRAGATNLPRGVAPEGGGMVGLVPDAVRSAVGSVDLRADGVGRSCAALAEALEMTQLAYLAVPLLARDQTRIGLLVLWFDAEPQHDLVRFVEVLSGAAALSVETRGLIRAQKRLFEAFIQMLAGAIDAKSPYTGGHCARVPVLTELLARAACDATDGPFKDFRLGDDDWEAVHIAAWLHDCGKVATPESIVDKATKLELRYNRIHEIRMRFEVKKRDAEIACLTAIADGADPAETRAGLARDHARLDADFTFVAACNVGGEAMAATDVERLRQIGGQTWLRTLDDRLGLSEDEFRRHGPAQLLPAIETLLADKPAHREARGPDERIAPDNRWGFRLQVPALRHNHGELANLSVSRGTLTEEDRYTINEHIVQTIRMLDALPFPRHLRAVPEIAGGHHEKMNGTGYPRGLTGDAMSPVARMMAIADIFEALTAAERPYKKGKKLSEAIGIMARMRDEGHIDPDLFALFLRSGVFREYAEAHLSPDHVDEVDVEAALAPIG